MGWLYLAGGGGSNIFSFDNKRGFQKYIANMAG